MDQTLLAAVAAHEKLMILLESAVRSERPVAVRIDPTTHMALRAHRDESSGAPAVERTNDGDRWRGLPIVLERAAVLRDASILTIEVVDGRSGRTRYVNWHENPEGYL